MKIESKSKLIGKYHSKKLFPMKRYKILPLWTDQMLLHMVLILNTLQSFLFGSLVERMDLNRGWISKVALWTLHSPFKIKGLIPWALTLLYRAVLNLALFLLVNYKIEGSFLNFNFLKLKFIANNTLNSLNPLSTNPIKWSNTLKQLVGKLPPNCLSVFDHFVGLALKGLRQFFDN